MHNLTLFDEKDSKTETLTLRLSFFQKRRINQMAIRKGMNTSKFVMHLIALENTRLINEELFDPDNGLPF